MPRDHEIRILAATLERLQGRDELVGMLARLSPGGRMQLRQAIHAEFAERRNNDPRWDAATPEAALGVDPFYLQPKLLRRP